MNRLVGLALTATLTVTLAGSGSVLAQPGRNDIGRVNQDRSAVPGVGPGRSGQIQPRPDRMNSVARAGTQRFSRGDRLPDQYRQGQYQVSDWQQRGLRQPPRGYHWVRNENNDFFLALMATGIIAEVVPYSDRDQQWRRGYARTYSYNDDVYYQQCRSQPDPAGVLIGGLIGGLLGNAAGGGRNRTGATLAGVIFGGAVGAALTSKMDCEDRSFAYKTYYSGFNSGRTGNYQWNNPRNNHRGEFRINSYYNDQYGFRCARFNQVTYIQGRSYNADGVACRQPDGSWAAVN
jgi:Ni/Co efflux regulator RcnB/surface antigen